MYIVPNIYYTEAEARKFVRECENEFEAQLTDIAENICKIDGLKIIGLSGPSCSGKTTTAEKLISTMTALGKKAHVISIDNFYYDRDILIARSTESGGKIDYDSVSTIDIKALSEAIEDIFVDGENTHIPVYDFMSGKRSGYTEFEPFDGEVFIFEGIQAIYPEITRLFKQHSYKSVVIHPSESIKFGNVVFQPNEIRFMRRLVRDYGFRNASPQFTFMIWESVRANEDANIFPYIDGCDIQINSTQKCEINLLAPYLIKILVPMINDPEVKSEYREAAGRMLSELDGVCAFDKSYLSPSSLYHEFI